MNLAAGIVIQNDELKAASIAAFPGQLGVSVNRLGALNLEIDFENIRGRVCIAYLQTNTAFTNVTAFDDNPFTLSLKNIAGFGLHNGVNGDIAFELNAGMFTLIIRARVVAHKNLKIHPFNLAKILSHIFRVTG